jgi:hypothetical protein
MLLKAHDTIEKTWRPLNLFSTRGVPDGQGGLRKNFGPSETGETTLLCPNQSCTYRFDLPSFADQIIHNVAFARVFLALDLSLEPLLIGRCKRNTLSGHGASTKNQFGAILHHECTDTHSQRAIENGVRQRRSGTLPLKKNWWTMTLFTVHRVARQSVPLFMTRESQIFLHQSRHVSLCGPRAPLPGRYMIVREKLVGRAGLITTAFGLL